MRQNGYNMSPKKPKKMSYGPHDIHAWRQDRKLDDISNKSGRLSDHSTDDSEKLK